MDKVVSTLCRRLPGGTAFQPSDINLTDYFVAPTEEEEEDLGLVEMEEWGESAEVTPLNPRYPLEANVVAIDSTSLTLGYIPDGIIGGIRASVIIKPPGTAARRLERYGPYLIPITNQNKEAIYRALSMAVYGQETRSYAPDCIKTLDRVRNLLERHIQFEVAKGYEESLILLDGSLIGRTIADPTSFVKKIMDRAAGNRNPIVGVSKSTGLTLRHSLRSILSLLDGVRGPCYVGGVKDRISQNRDRYLGDIYVAKLTPLGEPFRIDIPPNTIVPHEDILGQVAGLAGDYGYPEELKLAHMMGVFSSLEVIELQAAAIGLHGLTTKEDLRRRIFPL